jgi:hypothetical protein
MPDLALHELATEGTGGAAGCDSTSTVCLSSDRFCPGSPGSQTLMDAPPIVFNRVTNPIAIGNLR